jgi:hypothetical protein
MRIKASTRSRARLPAVFPSFPNSIWERNCPRNSVASVGARKGGARRISHRARFLSPDRGFDQETRTTSCPGQPGLLKVAVDRRATGSLIYANLNRGCERIPRPAPGGRGLPRSRRREAVDRRHGPTHGRMRAATTEALRTKVPPALRRTFGLSPSTVIDRRYNGGPVDLHEPQSSVRSSTRPAPGGRGLPRMQPH